jgi:myo-inositol-1(or 4)-monophosphatase
MNNKLKQVLMRAADEAAKILTENIGIKHRVGRKRDYSDLVTEIDKKSEAKIIEVIHESFPRHNVLSEEIGNLNLESDFVWIVDPLDGTINYTHSVPIFSISIALEIKKKLVMGLVYNPINGEKFFAEAGKGAVLNGKKIQVSKTEKLKDSLLVTGFPYNAWNNAGNCIDHFVNFIKTGVPVRRLGSAAIDFCYVACGRFDGFWEVTLNPWDVAAGYLMLKEAGGLTTHFSGEEFSIYGKEVLASNGRIHREMIDVLKRV